MNASLFRRLGALALCLALCLALPACGDKNNGPAYAEGPRFTVAVAEDPDSFNPVLAESGLSQEFFLLVYDSLWRLGADGMPRACLAEDWSLSSDRLTWTIRLRRDAVFSDGVPVTAADVLFSYDLLSRRGAAYADYFEGVSAVRQADDYTVIISTDYVKGDMLYNPAPVLPKHIWQDYEFNPDSFDNAALIGSGPFTLDPAGGGEEGYLFRARTDHFDGAPAIGEPAIGELFFRRYGTATGAGRAVAAGEADASFGLTDVQLTTLENVPGVTLIQAVLPETECMTLALNTRTDFLSAENLRRAVEYAVDRSWFLSMAVGNAGEIGSSFVSPGLSFFARPEGLRGCEPDTALGLIVAAGYNDSNGDGILDHGLRATKLTLRLCSSSREGWSATAATILAADLGELGVEVDWRKTDGPVSELTRSADDWDLCLLGWRGSPSAAVTAGRFRDALGALTGWTDPNFESDLALLRSAEDPAVALGYVRRLQQIAYDACPVIVLGYAADIQALRSDRWTGYEDLLAAGGGLFRVGSAEVYTTLRPRTAE